MKLKIWLLVAIFEVVSGWKQVSRSSWFLDCLHWLTPSIFRLVEYGLE